MKPDKPTPVDPNQGEGDRVAARHYNQQLRDFVTSGKVEPAAQNAEAYVAHNPADAARAERRARRGPHTRITLDELIAKGRTVIDRVRPLAERALARFRTRLARK
jgi:hypothetical protein